MGFFDMFRRKTPEEQLADAQKRVSEGAEMLAALKKKEQALIMEREQVQQEARENALSQSELDRYLQLKSDLSRSLDYRNSDAIAFRRQKEKEFDELNKRLQYNLSKDYYSTEQDQRILGEIQKLRNEIAQVEKAIQKASAFIAQAGAT